MAPMTGGVLRWVIRPNTYHDSVKLMRLSEALSSQPGVLRAAAVMATPLNVDLLADDGLLPPDLSITPDDLLVAVLADHEDAAAEALTQIEALLAPREVTENGPAATSRTIEDAAARTEAEVALKTLATERDLLMMGPDCGTSILGGIGLGFANRVELGPVGIVGASGTGIQQVCCLLDGSGIGVAQAIGTGGRDLSAEVDGAMTRKALRLLQEDDAVKVILLISKPAGAGVADALHQDLRASTKPVIACLLGTRREPEGAVRYAGTLTYAAEMAARMLGLPFVLPDDDAAQAQRPPGFHSRVYGLFSGGTLSSEAAQVLDALGVPHTLVDLGADRYTRGRAHPMIDPRFRASLVPDTGRHGDAGAVLLDVVLGDLAHPDPAGALLPAIEELRSTTDLPVLAVLVGTRRDPQGLARQRELLEDAGVRVFASNARAAAAAGAIVGGGV